MARLTDSIDELASLLNNNSEANQPSTGDVSKVTEEVKPKYGIGLDVGTGFLVSAKFSDSKITYVSIRDCFYELEKHLFNANMFDKNKMMYIETTDKVFVVGDDAMTFARIRNQAASRPLSKGVINPQERSSASVLKEMFRYLIQGHLAKDREKCVFSIPGPQIDNPAFDTIYHSMSLSSLLTKFGCDPVALNEAYAVIISELGATDDLTGIGISFGAGLVNCAFVFKGISLFEFSINKSGDFIDQQVATVVGSSESTISHIKEKKLNLLDDEYSVTPEERALIFSYRYVLQNTLSEIRKAFLSKSSVNVIDPVPIIISGGTSLPPGFIDLFKQELKTSNLPFECSDVIHAKNPLHSVAKGCLIWANSLEG